MKTRLPSFTANLKNWHNWHWLKVARTLFNQSALPIVCGGLFAWWEAHTLGQSLFAFAFFKSWVGVTFVAAWFTGQWFRADKQISDSEKLNSLQTGVSSTHTGIANILVALHEVTSGAGAKSTSSDVTRAFLADSTALMYAPSVRSAIGDVSFKNRHLSTMVDNAINVFNRGEFRLAAIMGLTALEYAVRAFADPHAVKIGPIGGLLYFDLPPLLGDKVVHELDFLLRASAHLLRPNTSERTDAALIGYFLSVLPAIRLLDSRAYEAQSMSNPKQATSEQLHLD